jgi:hypothetical protein
MPHNYDALAGSIPPGSWRLCVAMPRMIGSSGNSGERRADFEEEVGIVAEAGNSSPVCNIF